MQHMFLTPIVAANTRQLRPSRVTFVSPKLSVANRAAVAHGAQFRTWQRADRVSMHPADKHIRAGHAGSHDGDIALDDAYHPAEPTVPYVSCKSVLSVDRMGTRTSIILAVKRPVYRVQGEAAHSSDPVQ